MIRRLVFLVAKRAIRDSVRTGSIPNLSRPGPGSAAVGNASRLEIRPAITTAQQMFKITPLLLIAVIGGFVLRSGLPGLLISGAVVAVVMASVVNFRRRANVVITPQEIAKAGIFGLRRAWPRDAVKNVLSARIRSGKNAMHNVFVLDDEDRPLVRLRETTWSLDDMTRVVRALDIPPIGPGKAITPQALAADYPRVLRWYERYPLATKIAIGVLLAIAVGLALLTLI